MLSSPAGGGATLGSAGAAPAGMGIALAPTGPAACPLASGASAARPLLVLGVLSERLLLFAFMTLDWSCTAGCGGR